MAPEDLANLLCRQISFFSECAMKLLLKTIERDLAEYSTHLIVQLRQHTCKRSSSFASFSRLCSTKSSMKVLATSAVEVGVPKFRSFCSWRMISSLMPWPVSWARVITSVSLLVWFRRMYTGAGRRSYEQNAPPRFPFLGKASIRPFSTKWAKIFPNSGSSSWSAWYKDRQILHTGTPSPPHLFRHSVRGTEGKEDREGALSIHKTALIYQTC